MNTGTHATGTRLVRIASAQDLLASPGGDLPHLLTPAELAQANARENPAEYMAGHLAAKGAATDALAQLLPRARELTPKSWRPSTLPPARRCARSTDAWPPSLPRTA